MVPIQEDVGSLMYARQELAQDSRPTPDIIDADNSVDGILEVRSKPPLMNITELTPAQQ